MVMLSQEKASGGGKNEENRLCGGADAMHYAGRRACYCKQFHAWHLWERQHG